MTQNPEARHAFTTALNKVWDAKESLSSKNKNKVIRIYEAFNAGVYPTGQEQNYIFGTLLALKLGAANSGPHRTDKQTNKPGPKEKSKHTAAVDIWIDIQGSRERILMTMAEMWRFLQIMRLYKESEWYAEMFSWMPAKRLKYLKPVQGVIQAVEHYHIKIIQHALIKSGGNISEAAELLGVARTTLQMQLKKYRIDIKAIDSEDFNAPMCAHALNELELAIIDDEVELMGESMIDNNLKRAQGIVNKLIAKRRQREPAEKSKGYLKAV